MPILRQMLEAWRHLAPTMRAATVLLPLLAAGVLVAVFCLVMPRSQVLFATPLQSEQLSQVDAQLAAWNIAHLTTVDNVSVDARARNTILLRLSLAGLPHAHIATSEETLAKASALTPDALLEAQSRTGLGGDVAIALRSINGIADASVVIAPARQATFTDESSSAASASVRISLRPGVVLAADAVDGIRAFVSSAVPFLSRDHVVLLDDHGVALGSNTAKADNADDTCAALQSAFDAAFGVGSTIVRVHAVYERNAQESHDIEHLPVIGAALTLQHSDEHFKTGDKQYAKHDATEERGSVVRDRQSTVTAGALDHLSVAILVDQTRNIDLVKVRKLALAATGLDDDNRYMSVEAVDFSHPSRIAVTRMPSIVVVLLDIAPYLASTACLLCFILVARKPVMKFARDIAERERIRGTSAAVVGIRPCDVVGILADEPPHTAAAVISALPTVTAAAVLDLYSSEERGAIVARMAHQASVFAPTWEQLNRAK